MKKEEAKKVEAKKVEAKKVEAKKPVSIAFSRVLLDLELSICLLFKINGCIFLYVNNVALCMSKGIMEITNTTGFRRSLRGQVYYFKIILLTRDYPRSMNII